MAPEVPAAVYDGLLEGGRSERGGYGFGRSRLVVLPMYVPWIMKGDARDGGSSLNHANIRRRSGHNVHRADGDGDSDGGGGDGGIRAGGCGGGFDRGNGYPDDEGGRSHHLLLKVGAKPTARISGRMMKSSPYPPAALPTVCRQQQQGEVCLFERDLLRSEWTEILVPVCTDGPKRFSRHRGRRSRSKKNRQRHRGKNEATTNLAVVLQVRSAGFNPKAPPLWLVRRDFAERAVKRIVSAAAAAVAQPRVEMTLLGLRGAVESMMSELPSTGEGGVEDTHPQVVGPSLPTGQSCKEVLCEAFWNATLVHKVRFRRAITSCAPDVSKTAVRLSSQGQGSLTTGDDTSTQQRDVVSSSAESTMVAAIPSDGREKDRDMPSEGMVVDATKEELVRQRFSGMRDSDPSTWFSTDGGHDWVNVGGRVSRSRIVSTVSGETTGQQQTADREKTDSTLDEEGKESRTDDDHFPESIEEAEEKKKKERAPQPLGWVPAEGDTHGGRPFRFFLPACIIDNAGDGRTGDKCRRDNNSKDGRLVSRDADDERVEGSSSNGDEGSMGVHDIRGDLRLVFWAVSPPSPTSTQAVHPTSGMAGQAPSSLEHAFGDTDGSTAMVVKTKTTAMTTTTTTTTNDNGRARAGPANARRGRRGGVNERKLLGWTGLVDDELLLQPPGHRVELDLSTKAGLDVSTAWSMAHDLKR